MMNPMMASSDLDCGGSGEDDRKGSIPAGLKGSWLHLLHPDPVTRRVAIRFKWLSRAPLGGRD